MEVMNLPTNGNGQLEKMAEGVWLRLLSRYAMIIGVAVLPLVGYIGQRVINATDRAIEQLQETTVQVKIMQQEIKDSREARDVQFNQLLHQMDDHEHRLRTLERPR